MEDMKIKVSRADCTQIDAKLTFNIKYERGSLRASPGNDLHVDFNSCQGTNPSNENDQGNDLASRIFRFYQEGKISEGTKDAVFDTLVGYAEPGNNANEEACTQAYEDAICDQSFTPTDEWLQVYGKGSQEDPANTYLEFLGPNSPYLPREGNFYIRRLCVDCRDSHNDIIYKRLTPLPDGFSIFDDFLGEWAIQNNELNVDFELYSNMLDALAERNRWTYCNYDDNVGFPRNCGPDGFVGNQWNSLTRGGRQCYGFYVYRANVDTEPPLPPQQDEDSLAQWSQVFGKGSQESPDIDVSFWETGSEYIPLSGGFYIRRICPNCRDSHKDIIYKRVTPLSADFDLPSLFLDTWSSEDNILITPDNTEGDFELYSSMSFALAGLMPWQFCNYDDNHIGFPRDCSPQSFTGGQWNSLNRGGQSDYGYYVWNGNPDL